MFKPGEKVKLVKQGTNKTDVVTVVENNVSEIVVDQDGVKTTFAHMTQFGGWKMLFEGLGGERCFSQRGPTYDIVSYTS